MNRTKKYMCPGYAEYAGKCTNEAGHLGMKGFPENDIWCARCDSLRLWHIEYALVEMLDKLTGRNK